MRRFLLGLLIAVCTTSNSATKHTDGSITLTKAEVENTSEMFHKMQKEIQEYEETQEATIRLMRKMQKKIDALEARKCI